MNGFTVEGQQLANPGECRRFGLTTKLYSFKSHNTHEDPRFGGPSL